MTRTVVYARLSQEEAQGKSATAEKLQARVDSSLRLAEQHGLTVLPEDIFIERESAGTISKRPVIQHILQLASTRQITHIITNHFDRLTRGNKADESEIEDAFLSGNIILITESGVTHYDDNYYERYGLTQEVLSLLARHERRRTISRIKAANAERTRQGKLSSGVASYGYKWVKPVYEDKRLIEEGHYIIRADLRLTSPLEAQREWQKRYPDKSYSETEYLSLCLRQGQEDGNLLPGVECVGGEYYTVCQIFQLIENHSIGHIYRVFREDGIVTRGGKWSFGAIWQLLKNPFYAGYVTHRRTVNHKGVAVKLPPDKWIFSNEKQPFPHPVTLQKMENLSVLMTSRLKGSPRKNKGTFTGLLHCGEGRRMRQNGACYSCPCAVEGNSHPASHIGTTFINKIMVALCENILLSLPEEANRPVIQTETPPPADMSHLYKDRTRKRQEITDLERLRSTLVRLHGEKDYQRSLGLLQAELQAIEEAIAELKPSLPQTLPPELSTVIEAVRTLGLKAIWENMTDAERRELCTLLIERVDLEKNPKGSHRNHTAVVTPTPAVLPFWGKKTIFLFGKNAIIS